MVQVHPFLGRQKRWEYDDRISIFGHCNLWNRCFRCIKQTLAKSCVTFMHNHNMEDVAFLVFQFFASLFQLFVIPTMSHRNRKSWEGHGPQTRLYRFNGTTCIIGCLGSHSVMIVTETWRVAYWRKSVETTKCLFVELRSQFVSAIAYFFCISYLSIWPSCVPSWDQKRFHLAVSSRPRRVPMATAMWRSERYKTSGGWSICCRVFSSHWIFGILKWHMFFVWKRNWSQFCLQLLQCIPQKNSKRHESWVGARWAA